MSSLPAPCSTAIVVTALVVVVVSATVVVSSTTTEIEVAPPASGPVVVAVSAAFAHPANSKVMGMFGQKLANADFHHESSPSVELRFETNAIAHPARRVMAPTAWVHKILAESVAD
jgi:hypothetical protein